MSSGNESDDKPMSTEMLEDIFDGSQSHPIINRIEARYKISHIFKQIHFLFKGELLSTRNVGKGSHKVFKAAINEVS